MSPPPPGIGRAGGAMVFPPSPNSALSKPDSFDYLTAEVRVLVETTLQRGHHGNGVRCNFFANMYVCMFVHVSTIPQLVDKVHTFPSFNPRCYSTRSL